MKRNYNFSKAALINCPIESKTQVDAALKEQKRPMNTTQRFSDRVDNYVKFRPAYPPQIVATLSKKYGMSASSTIADIGSGTGISTELFLKNGNPVWAIEPNEAMRVSAEKNLKQFKNFKSINGSSDNTTLDNQTVDFIIAAQAFHWFEPVATKKEFLRILKPEGRIVLIWNDRKTDNNQFAKDYESLIHKFSTDYKKVNHKNIDAKRIEDFMGPYQLEIFSNEQSLDFNGLLGRLASSSYIPNENHPVYSKMVIELKTIFGAHQLDGVVKIEYETKMYVSSV